MAALLLFAPESQYYLTGYDTSGYVFFQCLVLTVGEEPFTLLTRRPDLEQARRTSIIEDVRIWYDGPDADPSRELMEILREKGLKGAVVGLEMESFGLSASRYAALQRRFSAWCELRDGSAILRRLRLVKSEAELVYVRQAAALADDMLTAMLAQARPGAFEGDIAAAGQSVLLAGGGDPAPSGPVLGSGERALLIRSATGYRHLDPVDQLTLEFAASYRRYCACLMRSVAVGQARPGHERLYGATHEALTAMTEAARPGRTLGEIDEAHRRVYDKAGFGAQRMAACGYSLGATYRPSWMDVPPMLYSGNETPAEVGMTLFLHAILIDAEEELVMSLGHTVEITNEGAAVLSALGQEGLTCCS